MISMIVNSFVTLGSSFIAQLMQHTELHMETDVQMPMHMFDMWIWLLAAPLLTLIAVLAVLLAIRPSLRGSGATTAPLSSTHMNATAPATLEPAEKRASRANHLRKAVELVRPTLTNDERRILNEIVKAGGEILQSDLPEKSDFSKATVSKLVKSLDTMGITTRERHKWTYWVRLSDKLISEAKNT